MAMAWITSTDLEARYGVAELDRVADFDGDGERDAGVVETAIAEAEGRVRSRLLTRYKPAELPVDAPEVLKRVVRDFAWWELHRRFTILPDAVIRLYDDAREDLAAIVDSLASLTLEDEPAVDISRPSILTSESRPTADRMTLRDGVLDYP